MTRHGATLYGRRMKLLTKGTRKGDIHLFHHATKKLFTAPRRSTMLPVVGRPVEPWGVGRHVGRRSTRRPCNEWRRTWTCFWRSTLCRRNTAR